MNYAFIFPGQGSQSVGMGKDFYDNFSLARDLFQEASDILKIDMQKLLFEKNDQLDQTQFTQPAIFLVSYIAHTIFQDENPTLPTIGFGHSLGEVSAVSSANGLSFQNALKLVQKRGELMQKACEGKDAGMMVVVGLDDKVMEDFCQNKSMWCANYNGNGQIVLAGVKSDLLKEQDNIKSMGAKIVTLLPMSVASHCPLLESIVEDFKKVAQNYLEESLSNPILSNVTLEMYNSKQKALDLLSDQLTKPVLYKQSILKIEDEVDAFIEFGNGSVLKGLNKRLTNKPTLSVSDHSSLNECINYIKENQ